MHRRDVWEIIERLKRNRVVILTTHAMEEADLLADKIVMLVGGRVRAVGSAIELKSRYGAGWTLDVADADDALLADLRAAAPSAVVARASSSSSSSAAAAASGDVQLRVGREAADELAALARTLERRAASFVVRQSTLEDVFEAVASLAGFVYEEVAVPDDDDDRGGVDGVGRNDVASGDATTRKSTAAASFVPPIVSPAAAAAAAAAADDELGTPSPYLASMAKNAKLQLAQRGANVCQMITPVLMIVTLVIIEALLYNQVRRRRLRDADALLNEPRGAHARSRRRSSGQASTRKCWCGRSSIDAAPRRAARAASVTRRRV